MKSEMLNIKVFLCFALVVFSNQAIAEEVDEDDFFIDISHFPSKAFGLPDPKSGERIKNWTQIDGNNPEEQGTYYEGDILIQPSSGKYGITDRARRWPAGIVPYKITGSFNSNQLAMIMAAMNIYAVNTCIVFIPQTTETNYVEITSKETGCYASIGRAGGVQELNLQIPGCVTLIGTCLHEMMHTIGFFHEHTRYDRDSYVRINFDNIVIDNAPNFQIIPNSAATTYGYSYDYDSVMHYSRTAFSKNGAETITPLRMAPTMGQRTRFSVNDIRQINNMYNCPARSTSWFDMFCRFIVSLFNSQTNNVDQTTKP